MQPKRTILPWSRVVVLIWASLWMLAVPLFHVHPEADHRHGETGHVHGGTVHLAWSPDLDCEFNGRGQADPSKQAARRGFSNFARFSHPGDSHVEFSLSLLSDSTDRKSPRPFMAQALASSSAIVSQGTGPVRLVRNTTSLLSSALFSRTIAPRAPPHLI